ncbi:hypothetical protein OAI65_01920 [Candidatus Poseidoniales archaeon]|nr:hypothetical protein [Candidatus Poseidoniales archaeon]
MKLNEIVERLAEQVKVVDDIIPPNNDKYIGSIGTANEKIIVHHLIQEWLNSYPEELPNVIMKERKKGKERGNFEISYQHKKQIKLDFGFSSSTADIGFDNLNNLEWAIEFKKINFVGDTGADFSERAVGKLTSPLPATGPILLDALRIRKHEYGHRRAVILLSPDVLKEQLQVCKDHPRRYDRHFPDRELDRHSVLKGTFTKNENLNFESVPLFPLIESIFDLHDIEYSDCVYQTVTGLTRHPIFSRLTIAGWEIFSDAQTDHKS